MAARTRKTFLSEEWKERIKAGGIMAKLMKHVDGEIEMSPTQVKAADILLKKIVPDLARAEIKHEGRIELTNTEDDAKVLSRFMSDYKPPDKTIQ